jgi:uncharacterized membrane-anchored protein
MRGEVEADTLLRIVLALAVIWLVLEILEAFVDTLQFVLQPVPKIIGVVLIVLIAFYLLDRI